MAALELRSRTGATENRPADAPKDAPGKKPFFPALPPRAARPLRKTLYFVHLWVGLLLGLYFVVLGITGSILVFRDEIDAVTQPALYRVAPPAAGATYLPLDKAADAVTKKFPDTRVSAVVLPTGPNSPLIVQYGAVPPTLAPGSQEAAQAQASGPGNNGSGGGGRGTQERGGAAPPRRQQAFVNPYTGDILGQRGIGGSFIGTVHSLHEGLLLERTGRQLNGYGSLFLFALVVSGIWLWWPSVRDWSRQFKQRTRMKKGAAFKRQMHDLHNVVGFYSCAALLLIVITGASQIWRDQARAIIFAMTGTVAAAEGQNTEGSRGGRGGGGRGGFGRDGGGQNGQNPNGVNNAPATNEPPALTLDQVAVVAGRVVPDTTVRALQMPRRVGGTMRVTLSIGSDAPGIRARQVTVEVNQRTGRIGDIVDPRRMPLGIVLNSWLTSIHYGQWGLGGTYYAAKIIHCLVGLTPLLLFGTGLIMWWEKRKGKMANQKKRSLQSKTAAV